MLNSTRCSCQPPQLPPRWPRDARPLACPLPVCRRFGCGGGAAARAGARDSARLLRHLAAGGGPTSRGGQGRRRCRAGCGSRGWAGRAPPCGCCHGYGWARGRACWSRCGRWRPWHGSDAPWHAPRNAWVRSGDARDAPRHAPWHAPRYAPRYAWHAPAWLPSGHAPAGARLRLRLRLALHVCAGSSQFVASGQCALVT